MPRPRDRIPLRVQFTSLWIASICWLAYSVSTLRPAIKHHGTSSSPYDLETFLKRSSDGQAYDVESSTEEQTANQMPEVYNVTDSAKGPSYAVEILPGNTEDLQPGHWIFLRICTSSLEPSHNTSGYTYAIWRELQESSCALYNPKRRQFDIGQRIVISIRNRPAIICDLFAKRARIIRSFQRKDIRFWFSKSQDTLVLGLRPGKHLDRAQIDIHMERYVNTGSIRTLSNMFNMPVTLNEQGNAIRRQLQSTHLKRFSVRFSNNPWELRFDCNKTDPYVLFEQFANSLGLTGIPLNRIKDSQEGRLPASFLWWDSPEPDPFLVNEILDDMAIQRAQRKIQTGLIDQMPHPIIDQSDLSIPDQAPDAGTVLPIVQLGELVAFTCQATGIELPIQILYDRNIWSNVSYAIVSSNPPSRDHQIHVMLRAVGVTWFNASLNSISSMEYVTVVKCGCPVGKQTGMSPNVLPSSRPPIAKIYLTVVTQGEYQGLLEEMNQKRGVALDTDVLDLEVKHSQRLSKEALAREKSIRIGFWNLPLARLSVVKLTIAFILVFLILSLLILTVCQLCHIDSSLTEPRNEVIQSSTPVTLPTWSCGGDQVNSQATNSVPQYRSLFERCKRRWVRRNFPSRQSNSTMYEGTPLPGTTNDATPHQEASTNGGERDST